jgi:hypothetical protein
MVISTIHPDAKFSDYKPKEKNRFELLNYNVNFQHSTEKIIKLLEKNHLHIESILTINIDYNLERYYTPESYAKIRGTPFLMILKIKNSKKCLEP